MLHGFSTLLLIMEEPGEEGQEEEEEEEKEEEEDSPRLVADSAITQWPHQASQTTLWEPPGDHRQHLAQAALVC